MPAHVVTATTTFAGMDVNQDEAADEFAFQPAASFDFTARQVSCLPSPDGILQAVPDPPPPVSGLFTPR